MTLRAADRAGSVGTFFAGVDTLPALVARRAELSPATPAYFEQSTDDAWRSISWADFHRDAMSLAARLEARGIAPGSRVGIVSATCLAWELAQMAVLACGGIVAGIDPYYPDALIDELVIELNLGALIVQDQAMLARLSTATRERLGLVVLLNDPGTPADRRSVTLSRLQSGAVPDAATPRNVAEANRPALVAFSSGSTGRPRPVLYTHAQVVHACRAILELYPELSPGTRLVCWLPLANLFQRMINLCAAAKGATSYVVADPRKVMDVLPVARPEVFIAVPRFCERVHAAMMERIAARPRLDRLVEIAIRLNAERRSAGTATGRGSPMKRLAARVLDRLVLARLRSVFGGSLRFIVSGSAPMPVWLIERFEAIGIPVLEAYGVSENLVPVSANRLHERKPGTVGKPVGDNEVRISLDGEVEVRGFGVFTPTLGENVARAESLKDDGFLATGDLGSLDDEGYLTLRGRRAEAFKSAQGRWIALPAVEAALRRVPGVEHAAVVRMADDQLIGVLAVSKESAGEPAQVEQRLGPGFRNVLARALEALPAAARPVGFVVACTGFSPATGELTTNLKLRRAAIVVHFDAALQAIQSELAATGRDAGGGIVLRFA